MKDYDITCLGSQHPSPNVKKALCHFEPKFWLEIITSRDAKSACFERSKTSCLQQFLTFFGHKTSHHVMDASCWMFFFAFSGLLTWVKAHIFYPLFHFEAVCLASSHWICRCEGHLPSILNLFGLLSVVYALLLLWPSGETVLFSYQRKQANRQKGGPKQRKMITANSCTQES